MPNKEKEILEAIDRLINKIDKFIEEVKNA